MMTAGLWRKCEVYNSLFRSCLTITHYPNCCHNLCKHVRVITGFTNDGRKQVMFIHWYIGGESFEARMNVFWKIIMFNERLGLFMTTVHEQHLAHGPYVGHRWLNITSLFSLDRTLIRKKVTMFSTFFSMLCKWLCPYCVGRQQNVLFCGHKRHFPCWLSAMIWCVLVQVQCWSVSHSFFSYRLSCSGSRVSWSPSQLTLRPEVL